MAGDKADTEILVERPPMDLSLPTRLATATFAFG